jgi:hypothetical protein
VVQVSGGRSIGSANLTGPGLTDDGEQALLVTVPSTSQAAREISSPFYEFWNDEHLSDLLTDEIIKQYAATWKPPFNPEKYSRRKIIVSGSIKDKKAKQHRIDKYKSRYHYFYVPADMDSSQNRVIGRETGWSKRGYTWLGLNNKKRVNRQDYVVIDARDYIDIGRVAAIRYDLAGMKLVVAYRPIAGDGVPSEVSDKIRYAGIPFNIYVQRRKTQLSQKLFSAIKSAIKK